MKVRHSDRGSWCHRCFRCGGTVARCDRGVAAQGRLMEETDENFRKEHRDQ
jgi:hypothetical protein